MAVDAAAGRPVSEGVGVLDHAQLALVLHEIRQPLAAVFALAEAARGAPDVTDEVREYLDLIIEQSAELSGAVRSVLAAGVDPGSGDAIEAEASPLVDVDEVLDSVIHAFRLTWCGTLRRRGDRGDLVVRANRATLRRCVMNVVDNAVRAAGPAGNVTLTVYRQSQAFRIVVDDDGPGFGRVPKSTGLGLAVTREALGLLGGHLSIGLPWRSSGARVALSLPLAVADSEFLLEPVRVG